MPRTVSTRESYANDVAALSRLAAAIQKDPRRSDKWKKKAASSVNALMIVLLNADFGKERSRVVDHK